MTQIDIAAGQKNYLTEQSFALPVAVKLLSLYPHAHYVCREMQVTAKLPDGRELVLLKIPDWDFNWQDQYYLKDPLALPAGTRLKMVYVYDNSAENPRNPWHPPRRVIWGDRSFDEMGSLALQLLPANQADLTILREASFKHDVETSGAYQAHYNYANALQARGEHTAAVPHFRKSIALNPKREILHHNLAGSLAAVGELDDAITSMREAIRLNPEYADAHCHLGNFMVMKKAYQAALECYRRAVEIDPSHAQARQNFEALHQQLEKGR
jgi:tetratricopeptide (TPR) repeat protein